MMEKQLLVFKVSIVFLIFIDQLQWTYQFWKSIHLLYLKDIPNYTASHFSILE